MNGDVSDDLKDDTESQAFTSAISPEERRANTPPLDGALPEDRPPLGADEPPQAPTDDDRAEEVAAEEAYRELDRSDFVHEGPSEAKHYVAPDGSPGGQRADDTDKIRFDLIPPWPFYLLGQVYTIGANKYGDDNWKKGMSWMRMVGSMKRHLEAFILGESMDQEDGQHHLASVAWGAFALMEYELFRPEFDDRPANIAAIAAALAERADAPPPPVVAPEPPPTEELTDEEKDLIDCARSLLADKSQAATEYLTQPAWSRDDPQAPADYVDPPEDLAAELAERPAVLAEMTADDDLTEEERELVRRAEEIAAAETPEVKQNRAERRRQEKIERKAERKPASRPTRIVGGDDAAPSVGSTRFNDVSQAARRGS